jgi:hypothetical protein
LGTTGLYRPPLPKEARLAKAGQAMRPIRTSKPHVTWIQGPGPSDLFTLRTPEGELAEQELTFFGRTVVVRERALMTGLCHEGGIAAYMGKTGLLDFDTKLSGETLQAALVLLGNVPIEHPDVEALAIRLETTLGEMGLPVPITPRAQVQ